MDSDSQESPGKEQDWAQSALAKDPLEKFPARLGDWKVTSLCSRDSSTTHHWLFLPWPQNSQFQGTAAQQPCPAQKWGFSSSPRSCRTQNSNKQTDKPTDHLKTRFGPFFFLRKPQQEIHYFPARLPGTVFKQISRTSYQSKLILTLLSFHETSMEWDSPQWVLLARVPAQVEEQGQVRVLLLGVCGHSSHALARTEINALQEKTERSSKVMQGRQQNWC